MSFNSDKNTAEDASRALKRILKLNNPDNPDYYYKDRKIGYDVVPTPKDKLDTPIGTREDGYLKLIMPQATKDFYYQVYFPATRTLANAKITDGLGFSWTPLGEWEKDQEGNWIFKVTEKVRLKLESLNQSNQWMIIGVQNPLTVIPGADAITRGNSQLIVYKDYTSITNGERVARIECDTNEYLEEVIHKDTIIVVEEDDIILKKEWVPEKKDSEQKITKDDITLKVSQEEEEETEQLKAAREDAPTTDQTAISKMKMSKSQIDKTVTKDNKNSEILMTKSEVDKTVIEENDEEEKKYSDTLMTADDIESTVKDESTSKYSNHLMNTESIDSTVKDNNTNEQSDTLMTKAKIDSIVSQDDEFAEVKITKDDITLLKADAEILVDKDKILLKKNDSSVTIEGDKITLERPDGTIVTITDASIIQTIGIHTLRTDETGIWADDCRLDTLCDECCGGGEENV